MAQSNSDEGTTITTPGENDVLCGREKGNSKHPGNKNYHRLIFLYEAFHASSTENKEMQMIGGTIIKSIEESGGRFLGKDKATKKWKRKPLKFVNRKVGQALREKRVSLLELIRANGGRKQGAENIHQKRVHQLLNRTECGHESTDNKRSDPRNKRASFAAQKKAKGNLDLFTFWGSFVEVDIDSADISTLTSRSGKTNVEGTPQAGQVESLRSRLIEVSGDTSDDNIRTLLDNLPHDFLQRMLGEIKAIISPSERAGSDAIGFGAAMESIRSVRTPTFESVDGMLTQGEVDCLVNGDDMSLDEEDNDTATGDDADAKPAAVETNSIRMEEESDAEAGNDLHSEEGDSVDGTGGELETPNNNGGHVENASMRSLELSDLVPERQNSRRSILSKEGNFRLKGGTGAFNDDGNLSVSSGRQCSRRSILSKEGNFRLGGGIGALDDDDLSVLSGFQFSTDESQGCERPSLQRSKNFRF